MKTGGRPHKRNQKCPLCMGVGKVYNDHLCPGCNGEGTFPCEPDHYIDYIDQPFLKPVTPSVRCDQYERLRTSWETHREDVSYFLSSQVKPGVSDERAACLAKEEQETMERVGSAMNSHRQICRPCMAEDKASLQHSMGY
jgi:hypothetical protein